MKKWPIALFLVFLVMAPVRAEDKAREEANMMLLKAADLETFKVGEAPKFRLEVHFSFLREGKEQASGTYLREVDTGALWHEDLQFGAFKYNRVRINKQIWTRQNYDFVPLPVEGLWGALQITNSRLADSVVVKRIKDRKIGDVNARCIEYENVQGNEKGEGQICVQADIGYVIYRQYNDRASTYSQFSPLGSKVRPRRVNVDFGTGDTLAADVNYVQVDSFDPAGFQPIINGEVSSVCVTSRPPIAKYAPDPVYPLDMKHSGYKGKVIVDVKVAADGHVLNTAVVQSLQAELDAAALEGVKKWQFEPGTCDGNPVISFTKVTATYK